MIAIFLDGPLAGTSQEWPMRQRAPGVGQRWDFPMPLELTGFPDPERGQEATELIASYQRIEWRTPRGLVPYYVFREIL